MNFPWAICVAKEDAAALASLRLWPGIEVAESANHTWLRGPRGEEKLAAQLAAIPALARYEWYPPQNKLRLVHERISAQVLPELTWQPLKNWLVVELPAAALPAGFPEPVVPSLIRTFDEKEPSVLVTTLTALESFVLYAPQVRLERLQFAAASDGQILLRGRPLPPVSGRQYVLHEDCLAVPAGYGWTPAVSAKVLVKLLNVTPPALVVWPEDNATLTLTEEQFLPLTRRAFLATQRAVTVAA
jgi:hypothetical protein